MFNDPYLKNLDLNCEGYEWHLYQASLNPSDESAHYLFKFPNGYGASVIKCRGSLGYDSNQWELAVIYFEKDGYDWNCCWDTPIGDDVFGWCTDEKVRELLGLIRDLPECKEE